MSTWPIAIRKGDDAGMAVFAAYRQPLSRLAIGFGLFLLSSAVFAQPQTKFVVQIGSNVGGGIHDACNSQIWDYVATHPNRTGGFLTFSTYGAALQAVKATPCGGFEKVRLVGSRRGSTYWSPPEAQSATVVDHFAPPNPSIADPSKTHFYYHGPDNRFFTGPYHPRIDAACEDYVASSSWSPTRESLVYWGNQDRWICTLRDSFNRLLSTHIIPWCPDPLFWYDESGTAPGTGKCVWLGQVTIWSVNVDNAKSIDAACSPTSVGNPLNVASGAKLHVETDFKDSRGLIDVVRTYSSIAVSDSSGWQTNWSARALTSRPPGYPIESLAFMQSSGRRITFDRDSWTFPWTLRPDADVNDVLTIDSLTSPTEIRLRQVRDGVVDYFDGSGQLTRRVFADGRFVTVSYRTDPQSLQVDQLTVMDHWGRSLVIAVDLWTRRFTSVTLPDNSRIYYEYDAVGRTTQVQFPDGARRLYHYNEQQHTSNASLPSALTGISEQGATSGPVRYGTYRYDALGRAIGSEHAGGVNRYGVTYPFPYRQSVVADPLGTQRTLNLAVVQGNVLPTSQSQPAGSGCGPSSSAITYDANANVTSRTDFNGQKTCYAYDLSRNLETKRVEGLAATAVCSTELTSPAAGARVIGTQWHSDWQLPNQVAEPKRITTIVYNGQGATCAPSTVLVDGKPPAVVCSRTEQATTDETGAAGFSATTTGTARTWRYTYTTYGRVLTATDPNNRTTTTSYHADNDAYLGKRGNVASITNAANHTTYITDYNAHGQPTRIVDPNGVVTVLTYDPRMRLTSRTVGNEATVFGYDPVGQMTSVNLPDGARLTYTYDAAHRLTAINDHKGNRIDYTLDAMGNRITEQMKDPGGLLVQNIARVIDALNRVQQVTGAVQ